MSTPSGVSHYQVGELIRLVATTVSTDGVTPADPSYIFFYGVDHFGTQVASWPYGGSGASVMRAGTGAYWKEVTATHPYGPWAYGCVATGRVQAVEEWTYIVERSSFFL